MMAENKQESGSVIRPFQQLLAILENSAGQILILPKLG